MWNLSPDFVSGKRAPRCSQNQNFIFHSGFCFRKSHSQRFPESGFCFRDLRERVNGLDFLRQTKPQYKKGKFITKRSLFLLRSRFRFNNPKIQHSYLRTQWGTACIKMNYPLSHYLTSFDE